METRYNVSKDKMQVKKDGNWVDLEIGRMS